MLTYLVWLILYESLCMTHYHFSLLSGKNSNKSKIRIWIERSWVKLEPGPKWTVKRDRSPAKVDGHGKVNDSSKSEWFI